jgi:hypothetical protein
MSHQCEVFNETGTCVHVEKRYIKVTVTDTHSIEQIEFWLVPGSAQLEIEPIDDLLSPFLAGGRRQSLRLTGVLSPNDDGHYAKQTICDE